ncbi:MULTISPECIES: hypothetical protein [Burkholderia]|uniref:hypothetical protein n=1 Tax=Burkholderia TaxID=32008 RepID=UPI00075C9DB3|nr:hypothetical protein WS84_17820 [Burkholderia anthina]KVH12114.1 hypothetical protein WS85_13110 [Burkholderia anthina]KVM84469.1 hypothetical protein WT06_29735 [Burkholderia anthina]KVN59775.1 hypothetical protein WT13_18915 [Burkholderia anthina]KVX29280.1 hypothetical protein WT32_29700 [Burkholderia anthina]
MNVTRMTGAVFGGAMPGALYDACGGGATGLRVAMLTGGTLQLAGAALAWRTAGAPAPIG